MGRNEGCMRIALLVLVGAAFSLMWTADAHSSTFDGPRDGQPQQRAGASPVEAIANRIKKELKSPAAVDVPEPSAPQTTPDAEGPSAPANPGARRTTKVATPKKPTGKGRVKGLETDAQQCQTAEEALRL